MLEERSSSTCDFTRAFVNKWIQRAKQNNLQGTSMNHRPSRQQTQLDRLEMLFCRPIGAFMSNPALFKLTKLTGEMRRSWVQIITLFLCFIQDHRPCLDGLCSQRISQFKFNDYDYIAIERFFMHDCNLTISHSAPIKCRLIQNLH